MKQLPDDKTYACPKCAGPTTKLKGFACYWCRPCDHVIDLWYTDDLVVIDASKSPVKPI